MSEKSQGVHYAWWVMIGCFFLQAGALGAIMNSGGIFIVPVCDELGIRPRCVLRCTSRSTSLRRRFTYPLVAKFLPKWDFRAFLTSVRDLVLARHVGAAMGSYQRAVAVVRCGRGPAALRARSCSWWPPRCSSRTGSPTSAARRWASPCAARASAGSSSRSFGNMLIETVGWRMTYRGLRGRHVRHRSCHGHAVRVPSPSRRYGPASPTAPEQMAEAMARRRGIGRRACRRRKAIFTLAFVCVFLYAGIEALFSGYNNHLPGFAESIGIFGRVRCGHPVAGPARLLRGHAGHGVGYRQDRRCRVHVHHAGHHGLASLLGFCAVAEPRCR